MYRSQINRLAALVTIGSAVGFWASASNAALLGYWNFNNNTSNFGSTGSTNDATAVNGATYVAGPTGFGNALAVNNGTASTVHYALVNNSATIGAAQGAGTTNPLDLVGTSYTWSIWAQSSNGVPHRVIDKEDGADFSGGYGSAFGNNAYTHASGSGSNFTFTGGTVPSNTAWHFYAVRYDMSAGSLHLFVDGVKTTLAASGVPALTTDTNDPLRFGNAAFSDFPPNGAFGYQGHNGAIDEARIYNEALSDAQIFALQVVPEPSSIVLAMFSVMGVIRLARRREARTAV